MKNGAGATQQMSSAFRTSNKKGGNQVATFFYQNTKNWCLLTDAQCPGYPRTICRIGLGAVLNMAQLDFTRSAADGACSVFEQHLLLRWRHQEEQGARLQAPDFLFRSFPILSICFANQFY